jgi:hypothetical protein
MCLHPLGRASASAWGQRCGGRNLHRPGGRHFTLHDFHRTVITDLQIAGVSEKETSLMVGATPEVIRKHYEKLEAMTIAKRAVERRISANHQSPTFVAPAARGAEGGLTGRGTCRKMLSCMSLRMVSEWLAATLETQNGQFRQDAVLPEKTR